MQNLIYKIPFITSFNSAYKNPLSIKIVKSFLGNTFYSRLNTIYINLLEAFAYQNYVYLSSSLSGELSQLLIKNRNDLSTQGFKIKIS
jgi:hypothetical protein